MSEINLWWSPLFPLDGGKKLSPPVGGVGGSFPTTAGVRCLAPKKIVASRFTFLVGVPNNASQ